MDLETNNKVEDNGKCNGENVDAKSTVFMEAEGTVGLAPSPATKGRGLRKWRRIRRDSIKEAGKQGSNSSVDAMSNVVVNALNHISVNGDLGLVTGPDFASRADSENSEDRNSRCSTAASVPRGNHELQVVDFGCNLSRNTTKKARGVGIKKENSISSMESDSRSSNTVLIRGGSSMAGNGRPFCRLGNYDDDNNDAQHAGRWLNGVSQTALKKNEVDFENASHGDLAGENSNSCEVKKEKIDDRVGSKDHHDLADSIIPLHLVYEALEREIEKLRDVGKDNTLSSDYLVQPSGFQCNKSNEISLQRKLEEAFMMLELKNTKISELESTLNFTKITTGYEELLTRRIAAELEYLVISKTLKNTKADYIDQVTFTVQRKNKATKTREHVGRYAYCFIIQSVLLLVVLYMFVSRLSSKTLEIMPT